MPSLVKKYLMALTGLVLVGFVVGHLVGNLQMFCAPEKINRYAELLHSMPPAALWAIRGFLAVCALVHIRVGILLARENRAARPEQYEFKTSRNASPASKFGFLGNLYMPVSGAVLLGFLVFHVLHFTVRSVCINAADYAPATATSPAGKFVAYLGEGASRHEVYNVHRMVVDGFSHPGVSIFYIVAMVLLFAHLAHGTSSMFQSVGFRNEKWRPRLDLLAKGVAVIVAAGFIAIPAAVLAGVITEDGPKWSKSCCPAASCTVEAPAAQ